jgi:predicted metal-dependent hydrolase
LPLLGGELRLHVEPGTGRGLCRRDGERLHVRAPHAGAARAAVETWYRREAQAHFRARVTHFAPHVGHAPRAIHVRAQRTRWGSCSARGVISLNWRLLQLPAALLDYVVVHELCHLRVPDHSPRFWAEVARILPDWRERRRALRAAGRCLA